MILRNYPSFITGDLHAMVNKVDGSANSTRLKVFDNRTSVPHKKQFTDQT